MPSRPPNLQSQVLFDDVDFMTHDELRSLLGSAPATPEHVEAVAINENARRLALQASFLIVGGISLLSILPARRLPRYASAELSAEQIVSEADEGS